MPFPGDITTITVTGYYIDTLGNPLIGQVSFAPTVPLADSTGKAVIGSGPYAATLYGGRFSIVLPCTNNATLSPTNFAYTVTEVFTGSRGTYTIQLPSTLGSTVDISTLAPANPPTPYSTIYGVLAASNAWTGALNDFTGSKVTVPTPTLPAHAATKAYADSIAGGGTPATTVVTETAYAQASTVGALASYAREDHTHGTPALTTTAATVSAVGDAAAVGTATNNARVDHVHGRESFATPGNSAVADAAAAGVSTSTSRADHKHGRESFGTPGSSAVGDVAAAGAAVTPARSDHTHGRESFGNVVALTAFNTASANGSAATGARSDHVHGAPASYVYDTPTQHGWLDWNFPSKQATSGKILATSGAVYLAAYRPMVSGTLTNLILGLSTAGVGLTNSFAGLYSQNGTTATLLSASADQSTPWQSSGLKVTALGAAQAVTAGQTYLVAILATWATTAPTFLGTAAANSTVFNGGQTAASPFEFGLFSSALAALPATITMSSITGGNTALPIFVASS